MLLEESAKLIVRIEEIERTKELARKMSALKSRAEKFSKLDKALAEAVRPIELMHARKVSLQLRGNYSGVREYFSKLRKVVSEKPQTLLEVDSQIGPMQQQVERIAEQAEKAAREAWIEDIDRRGQVRINEAVLRALGKIPEFRDGVSAVRRAIDRREALKSKLPDSDKQFDEADSIGREIAKTWKAVGSDEIPASVLDLLHTVGSRPVTLEGLDDEAFAWLRKKKLAKYFNLSLGNS